MVKRGGTKKKIAIEKIKKTESLRVTCTKRREGLFSKASQLCLLSGSQVAILATPPSAESNISFYSFGHSSVDNVISAFLSGQSPFPVRVSKNNREMREDVGVCLARKDLGLGFWWDDETLVRSDNPEEIREAVETMSKLLNYAKNLRSGETDNHSHQQAFVNNHADDVLRKNKSDDQTLITSEENCEEADQIREICGSFLVPGSCLGF